MSNSACLHLSIHLDLQAGAASYEQPDLARKTLLSTVFAGTEVAGEFKELQQILSSISASHHADDRQPPEDTALQGIYNTCSRSSLCFNNLKGIDLDSLSQTYVICLH